jgi:hypothetical protein
VRIVSPEKGEQLSGQVRVVWVTESDRPLYYLLRFSNDGGRTWRAVAPRQRTLEYTVDLDRLPGGRECLFQVLATEQIRTGVAISRSFSAPERAGQPFIVSPVSDQVIQIGEYVTLTGGSFSPQSGSADPTTLRWDSSIDGPLGIGNDVRVLLQPGDHTISLRAPDGVGGENVTSTRVTVRRPEPRGHTSFADPDHRSIDHDSGRIQ